MTTIRAYAKINLALVVGPLGSAGKHDVTTVLQRVDLADSIRLEPASGLRIEGFDGDTIVTRALEAIAEAAGVAPGWKATIDKQIPVAAGLGGGSADAAAALLAANATLGLPDEALHEIGAALGADVPFFLARGPQLGEGDGSTLTALDLRQDYTVLLLLPDAAVKTSTASVYAAFDERDGASGYERRRARLLEALGTGDLPAFPPNDLASSPLAAELRDLGAFRADVSGAGPALYALFRDPVEARTAEGRMRAHGRVWIVAPTW